MENHRWFLPRDNASAHRSVLIKDLLAKNNLTTQEHSPYFPDLVAADFYLFSGMKSALKRRRFCDVTDISKNATEELKRLSQNMNISKTFPVAGRSVPYSCTRGLF
jgi:transposase